MTSKLVVNTIEADTGISSVSFASSISLSSTSKFFFGAAGIDIGADTNINRPAAGVLGFNINGTEKVRIASNGNVGVNTDFTGSQTWRNGRTLEIFGGSGNVTGELHLGANRGDGVQSVGSINFFDNTQDSTHRHIALIEADKSGSTSNKRGGDILFFTKGDNVAAPTEKLRIDSTGALGLGITPKNNSGNYRQLQIGLGAHFYGRTDDTPIYLVSNGYRDGSDWKYTANTTASQIAMGTNIVFSNAASGTAGNAITFSEKLRITSDGKMGLGTGASFQTAAKLQVVGNVGAAGFYTTTTSSPQTDFTSSVATNKAGLLLHRLSETNGDYGGLEFHGHPSSITTYRKGGIYWQTDGSGFGRGDMVFVNDGAGDSANLQISDEKLRIESDGQHVKTKGATRYNNSSVTYYELPVFFSSGTTHDVFTISGSYDSGFVAFATLEYIGLYSYAGTDMSGGVRRAYTRRTNNNTQWRDFDNQVSENYGENRRPDINWVNGVLQVTTPGSTQITGYIRLVVHANSQSNYTVTLNQGL